MKTELTIEESARLIELGVDSKLASMSIVTDDYNEQRENFQHHPIFCLTDILSILPKEIIYCDEFGVMLPIVIHWSPTKWYAYYAYPYAVILSASELIDALYQLLIWAIENQFVNPKCDMR